MTIAEFIQKLNQAPQSISFTETISLIEENYNFEPTAFKNGAIYNASGQNSGSCKLFTFAQMNDLTVEQTLACFGSYYFEDVLKNPEGCDHQNIRNFMQTGWESIEFEGKALTLK
jgi:hypothetical protein